MKNLLNKKIYESMVKMKNDIEKILKSESFQKTIRYNFKESIEEYINFFDKYKKYNLKKCNDS